MVDDSDFGWMRCDTPAQTLGLVLLVAVAFMLWPLVGLFVLVAMGCGWRQIARRRLAIWVAVFACVTTVWCTTVLFALWTKGWL